MLGTHHEPIKKCLWLGLLASIIILGITLIFPNILSDWELKTYDYRMRARGKIITDSNITLIDIDDRSIKSIGRYPWDRSYHAKMIEILTSNNAHTIAYDILFHQPSDKQNDALLIEATKESKIYYPVGFDFTFTDISGARSSEEINIEYLKSYGFGRFLGETKEMLSVKRAIAPMEKVADASKGLGHISSNRDSDGVIRRVPLVVKLEGVFFPSFALISVMDYLDVPKDELIIDLGRSITLKGALFPGEDRRRDIVIPIDNRGMMLINYAGKWAETFHHYSFKNLIHIDAIDSEAELPDFKDNIIIVSNSASGYDIKPIPIENNYPGGGIHANIINTILTENFLADANFSLRVLIILALGLMGALSGLFIKWHYKIVSLILLLSGYIMVSFYVFKSLGFVFQVLTPSLTLILGSMLISFYQIQSERSTVISLSEEKQTLKLELELISKKLTKKEDEITQILTKLSNQEHSVIDSHLKEKLRTERNKKEDLEKTKVMILRQLSPFESKELQKEAENHFIVTKSRKLLEAFDLAKKVASTDHGVLLLGESGTGKELFARAIHAMSKRNHKELITVNVASIVPTLAESELFGHIKGAFAGADRNRDGLFQKADKGTLFLDEIGDLHPDIQAKLLRVLQDGEIRPVGSSTSVYTDIRIIAATDKNLEIEVRSGRFNKALFARLNRFPIILPPLRGRIEDIPSLASEFIKRHKGDSDIERISEEAVESLCRHDWTENVRQLENVIIRAIINTHNKELQQDDIHYACIMGQESHPEYQNKTINEDKDIEKYNSTKTVVLPRLIIELRNTQFNINKTAKIMNMSRNTATDHFKGICFKYIIEHNGEIQGAGLTIAGDSNVSDKVEKKIKGYYENLISHIKNCKESEVAKKRCRRMFKNIPREYSKYIENIIDDYFRKNKKLN